MKPWLFTNDSEASTTAAAASGNPDFTPAQPLNANGEQPRVDTAMLATREATLAGQLTALEARTAAVSSDAMAAGGQATRAEGLMVAFAARRAIDRGVGLGYIEEQLRLRFGRAQPRATAAVIQASHQPVTIEDLRQVAALGLVKAVDRFDPERGAFESYAVPTITGEIKRHFRDRMWALRVPRRVQELRNKVRIARREGAQLIGAAA